MNVRVKLCRRIALAIVVLAGGINPGTAHDIHISYCQSTLTSRSLAGKMTFYKDDFQKGLQAWSGRDLHRISEAELGELTVGYLREHVRGSANGTTAMSFTKIIRGDDGTSIWFEFEFRSPVTIQSVAFENRVLFKEFSDQINLVLVKSGSAEQSLQLTASEPRGVVTV